MGAPIEFCSKRGVVAVLASGVVISLTALTGGVAPAFAKPDNHSSPTTTVVAPEPEPEQSAPEQEKKAPEPEKKAPEPEKKAPEPEKKASEPKQQAPQQEPQAPQAPVAPATPAADEPAAKTPAPKTAVAPPVTSVETATPSAPAEPSKTAESEPTTTAARTPATESQPPSQSSAPKSEKSESPQSAETPESSTDSPKPSAALAPGSESSTAPEPSSTSESSTSESAPRASDTEKSTAESTSETPTVSISEAAKQIETLQPQTLDAPKEDVELARAAKPIVEPQPAPASKEDVASFSSGIETSLKLPGLDVGASTKADIGVERHDVKLVSQVRQWRPEWIQYDEYYRPIFMNPFHNPVRIVYMYERAPRIVIIPPLARMVIEAARYAAYSFTAAVLAPVVAAVNKVNAVVDTAQALTNIAVGSFFGGGYFPGIGLPLPPPPPPVLRYDNVPVFVNYGRQAQYEPFRVRQIVDVGDDAQFGERKVLLDGATPAWGVWTQTPTGERQFEVHRTQQFPGLEAPAQGPLPGDYKLRLLSDEAPDSGFTSRDIFLFVTAGVIGTLGFGAIGLAFFLGRRRPEA
jgi:hypothetical protein